MPPFHDTVPSAETGVEIELVVYLLCVRQVASSNLGPETGYPN